MFIVKHIELKLCLFTIFRNEFFLCLVKFMATPLRNFAEILSKIKIKKKKRIPLAFGNKNLIIFFNGNSPFFSLFK